MKEEKTEPLFKRKGRFFGCFHLRSSVSSADRVFAVRKTDCPQMTQNRADKTETAEFFCKRGSRFFSVFICGHLPHLRTELLLFEKQTT
jgi:hypothetical protein